MSAPGERRRLVKLVRDRVAGFLTFDKVEFGRIGREQHVEQLRAKLIEEATEYLLRPSSGELADVLEAVRSLAIVDLGYAPDLALQFIIDEADAKRDERGGFEIGTGMYVFGGPPTMRHEGEHQ